MSSTVRREFELDVEQNAFLRRKARETGVSEDELVRRAIDALKSGHMLNAPRDDAWNRLKAAMETRAEMDVPQTGRNWSREDLYDDGSHG